jgi:hypothetical protein
MYVLRDILCGIFRDGSQGRIQDFKLGGGGRAHIKKLRREEGGAKIFGVFRVKNHDFTPKNLIFSILGGRAPDAPPLVPPLDCASYPFVSYYYHGHWVYFGATYIVFRMLCGIFSASYPFVSYYYH